ncbi:MAG: tripartite tricarboxylate transporter substrate binding protein [Burkholderiales bacterium]
MTSNYVRGALAAAVLAPLTAFAQPTNAPYPTRTITFVVPYTPGTGGDFLARVLGPKLAERWKTSVVTDNRPGASGNIGADVVAKATPDGYTLLSTATSFGTTPALTKTLPFDPVKSFTPVALLTTSEMGLYVSMKTPIESVRGLVEAARAQPGKLNYASPGNGSPQHLAMELLRIETGIDVLHVPYKGSGGAVGELVGGFVQTMVISTQTATSYVQGGKLRMLAVMSPKRTATFPNVPTMAELGYPNLQVLTWYGLLAPAGTPAEIVTKLNVELNAILQLADVREMLAKQGMTAMNAPPERFAEVIRAELARWNSVVATAKIKSD